MLYAVGGIHSRSGCGPNGLLFVRRFEEGGRRKIFLCECVRKTADTKKKVFNGVLKKGIFSLAGTQVPKPGCFGV